MKYKKKQGVCSTKKKTYISKKITNEFPEVDTVAFFDNMSCGVDEKSNDKKIVFVTHDLGETGAPQLAYFICKSLKEKGNEIVVISMRDGYLRKEFNDLNISVFLLKKIKGQLSNDFKELEYVTKSLKKKGFSKVITNTVVSGITVPVFKSQNFKICSLIHEMPTFIGMFNWLEESQYIAKYSDEIVFPDQIVKEGFEKLVSLNLVKSKIKPQGAYMKLGQDEVFNNRESILKSYEIPSNSKVIVGAGTADLRKGADLFFSAMQTLISLESDQPFYFIWIGNFESRFIQWLCAPLKANNCEDRFINISFLYDKNEYLNILHASDCFWLTSREDPFPSVMMEAIGMGLPVISFKNNGGANTLLDDNRGILVENFDVSQMAYETNKLLKNEDSRNKMTDNAKKYLRNNLKFEDYVDFLENLLVEL